MQEAINFFQSIQHLEPKCPGCDSTIEYGLSTTYVESKKAHKCNKCGILLKK